MGRLQRKLQEMQRALSRRQQQRQFNHHYDLRVQARISVEPALTALVEAAALRVATTMDITKKCLNNHLPTIATRNG